MVERQMASLEMLPKRLPMADHHPLDLDGRNPFALIAIPGLMQGDCLGNEPAAMPTGI
jgi:hypothetical protein